jgi:hypothetical protein
LQADARTCPSSFTDGCRCPEHYSLREYQLAHGRPDFGLASALGNRPRPVVRDLADDCDGTMTCQCKRCQRERAERMKPGRFQARQPWEPS